MKRNLHLVTITSVLLAAATARAADKVTFEDDILPIFRNKCLKCHNADKMRADLDLSTYDATMTGSGNGPVLAGGDPGESLLYKVVAHLEKPTMPPKAKLPDGEIEMLKNHVDHGEVVVPKDHYFALGDYRDLSLDSRYWGFVPRENIIGKAILIHFSWNNNFKNVKDIIRFGRMFNRIE